MEAISAKEQALKQQVSWMDSILSLIPGRKQAASNEPSDEAVKRTHDYLRCAPMALSAAQPYGEAASVEVTRTAPNSSVC